MSKRRIPAHIKQRMVADSINQLPYLPKNTKEGQQIRKVGRKLSALYEEMD